MKNRNIRKVESKKDREFFRIGLVVGALRADMIFGNVPVEKVYELLSDSAKHSIEEEYYDSQRECEKNRPPKSRYIQAFS